MTKARLGPAMINADQTNDFDLVSQDPAAWYGQPQAILDDAQLRHGEKARLLDEWALDLADRRTAADEGMVPEVPRLIDRDVKMQDRIISAQADLATIVAEDAAQSLPQRLWRRITTRSAG